MKKEKQKNFIPSSFLPTIAVLEMTYRCNHACIFCSCPWFAPDKTYPEAEEMDAVKWMQVIDKLCLLGVTHIAFTGGEPLLKEGIKEIIAHAASSVATIVEAKSKGFKKIQAPPKLYLLTNSLVLDKDILELCRMHKIKLSLSLPGLKTFKAHTGVDNARGVLDNFKKARQMKIRTTVGVTVTRKNLPELYDTIAAAFIAGADSLLMNRFLPGGRGLAWKRELFLDIPLMQAMMDTAEEVLKRSHRSGSMGTEIPKCIVDTGRYSHLRVSTRCSAARDFFVIDPSGYIRVCNHSPMRLNPIDEIERIPENPYWKTFTLKDYLPDSCNGCRLTSECDGGCREAAHIVGKTVNAEDPVFSDSGKETKMVQ